jgi:hypothetical protein
MMSVNDKLTTNNTNIAPTPRQEGEGISSSSSAWHPATSKFLEVHIKTLEQGITGKPEAFKETLDKRSKESHEKVKKETKIANVHESFLTNYRRVAEEERGRKEKEDGEAAEWAAANAPARLGR